MEGVMLRTGTGTEIAAAKASSPRITPRLCPPVQFALSPSFSIRRVLSLSSRQGKSRTRLIQRPGVARAAVGAVDITALAPISIFTAEGESVQFKDLWVQEDGKAVVAFLRHFGCPFCWEFAAALRDAKPKFDAAGFKLITIGVGPPEKARVLAEKLPFPSECLYADPDRKAYDALGLYYGVGRTFLNPASVKIFGRMDAVAKAVKGYNLEVMPDNPAATLQQGGVYVFEGTTLLYARKDEATGDHADIDDILKSCCTPVLA